MAFCATCEIPIPDGAAFCGACGLPSPTGATTIPAEPLAEAMRPIVPSAPAGAPRPKAAAPSLLAVGALVDQKYSISRVLGQGGMGVVYLARDVHTNLEVVVKSIRRDLAHRPEMRARTLAEGRALAQIDHPNVVRLNAVVVEGDDLWLVMQYIDGETLDKLVGDGLSIERAVNIFRQIVAGVSAAHAEEVIHRDLKPANVIVRRKDGTAKVMDFGIAKTQDNKPDQTKGIIGSLWYMSPEQVLGRRDLDTRVDVYALGILFYQMLTGEVPFNAPSDYEIMKLQAEAPMPLAAKLRAEVSFEIDEIIQRACAKDRNQRFPTCEDLLTALEKLPFASPRSGRPTMERSALLTPTPASLHGDAGGSPHAVPASYTPAPPAGGSAVTATGTELSVERPGRGTAWIAAAAIVLSLVGVGVALFALGYLPVTIPASRKGTRPPATADTRTTTTAAHKDAKGPLDGLVGAWVGNGRELEAVLAGDVLEFRVKVSRQFAPQDYEVGEARFVLHATPDPGVFSVEDRIRPHPPSGRSFDPSSRGTCQEVWTAAGGEPLHARFDGTRLSVEFAKIEPTTHNFVPESGRIRSCVGLRSLRAARVVSTLSRP